MIGRRISARRAAPTGALVVLGIGVVLMALGMALGAFALVSIALAPLAMGTSLLIVGERGFRAHFTPTAIEIARPPQTIAYTSLLEVRPLVPAGRPRPNAFPIQVLHTGGGLVIPARLTLSSERVYAFLRGFVRAPPALPAALEAYRVEQEASFGAEKVWSYFGRSGGDTSRVRNLRALAGGFLATAAIWAALPLRRPDEPGWWMAAAALTILGAALLVHDATIRGRERSGQTANDATNAIVITPLGVAVQLGAISGHLTWQEIRSVSVRTGSGVAWTGGQSVPGVTLEVEGASILLTDSYNRPLSEIHDRILRYWR